MTKAGKVDLYSLRRVCLIDEDRVNAQPGRQQPL